MPPEAGHEARLRDYALRHMARFPASAARLARVLERRTRRLVTAGELERDTAARLVERVVGGLVETGVVDDHAYAEGRTRTLARRGRSRARIGQALAEDGIDRAAIADALASTAPDTTDLDRALAVRYARRRGLGPFRAPEMRQGTRDRDLRALLRQGFPMPVARAVIDAEEADALDDPLA